MRSPVRALVVGVVATIALTGCQAAVVTVVDPPGWGGGGSGATVAPGGPIMADVLESDVPTMCGIGSGTLEDGVLLASATAVPIEPVDKRDPVATEVRVGIDATSGKPVVALASAADAIVGAAAVFDCAIDGAVERNRVVLWDGDLSPVGVVNIASLVGASPVRVTAITIEANAAVVTFVAADKTGAAKPGATERVVPVEVVDGVLTVGSITDA